MQIVLGCATLAALAAIGVWHHYGTAQVKRKLAHWLMASAAGDDARDAAVAAAMRQVVKLEVQDAG
jgi:hypothetical protein